MFDFNITIKGESNSGVVRNIVKRCYELGWNVIAWNNVITGKFNSKNLKPNNSFYELDTKTKKILWASRALSSRLTSPLSTSCNSDDDIMKRIENSSLVQLNRLTFVLDEINDARFLVSGNDFLRSYDLIAAVPGNLKVFAFLCKSADVDIISLDFTHKLSFPLSKKLLDEAAARGVFFEITYSPFLSQSSNLRRETISNTRVMIEYMKCGSLIVSSGCDNFSLLRSPMDVANIMLFLKVKKEAAMKCVSDNGYLLLKRSLQRIKRNQVNNNESSDIIDETKKVASILANSRHSYNFDVAKVSRRKRKEPDSDTCNSNKTNENRNKKMRKRRDYEKFDNSDDDSDNDDNDYDNDDNDEDNNYNDNISLQLHEYVTH